MSNFVCLVRNGALYFIGITNNLDRCNQSMKPGILLASLSSQSSEKICKELHQRYETNRLPSSDYFRLSTIQAREVQQYLESCGGKQYVQTIFKGYRLFFTFIFFWFLITLLIVEFGVNPIISKFL
tara:strand:+ start:1868 stop:2245 length:378 start_codon:yes stop_codon:yes gene_type:complete